MPPAVRRHSAVAYSYLFHPHHRNGNRNKSQWHISEIQEHRSFRRSYKHGWLIGNNGWGIHLNTRMVSYCGVATDRSTQLIVAKYVKDPNRNDWHGYPADHRKQSDIPDIEIQRLWIEKEVLPITKLSKIFRGKRCAL